MSREIRSTLCQIDIHFSVHVCKDSFTTVEQWRIGGKYNIAQYNDLSDLTCISNISNVINTSSFYKLELKVNKNLFHRLVMEAPK